MASGTLRDCGRKIQPFPFNELYGASGGIVDGFPMVCGGRRWVNGQWKYPTTCHSLNQGGRWIEDQTATVSPGRRYSGSVVLQKKLHMVGGFDGNSYLDSILALKPNTSMVASPGNEAVYSFGGSGAKNKIFKFTCPDDQIQNCQWEEMGTRLTYTRQSSVAMTIPVDLAKKLC